MSRNQEAKVPTSSYRVLPEHKQLISNVISLLKTKPYLFGELEQWYANFCNTDVTLIVAQEQQTKIDDLAVQVAKLEERLSVLEGVTPVVTHEQVDNRTDSELQSATQAELQSDTENQPNESENVLQNETQIESQDATENVEQTKAYNNVVIQDELGVKIKEYRDKQQINQNSFAKRLGISKQKLSGIENGKLVPDADLQERLVQILDN